jgi:hypothetical protein
MNEQMAEVFCVCIFCFGCTSLIFLQRVVEWVSNFTPSFGTVLTATVLMLAANTVVYQLMKHLVSAWDVGYPAGILILVVMFLVSSGIYGNIIEHPKSGSIGFRNGCRMNLILYFITACLLGITYILKLIKYNLWK